MGGLCCKCYQEPSTDPKAEAEAEAEPELALGKAPPMRVIQSVPSSSAPAILTETNGKFQNGKSTDIHPRERLINFYKIHNPQKINVANIDEVLRRYKGRETKLFVDLNRKYNVQMANITTIIEDDVKAAQHNDAKSDDCDENSPLNTPQAPPQKKEIGIGTAMQINTTNSIQNATITNRGNRSPSSPKKISKLQLASESPPDSEAEEAEQQQPDLPEDADLDYHHHPMLDDSTHSESVPINAEKQQKQMKITINHSENTKAKQVNLNKDLFKIQVTKPHKKKKVNIMGTNLFGGIYPDNTKKRNSKSKSKSKPDAFEYAIDGAFSAPVKHPTFADIANASASSSRSTSFIVGSLGTPIFGADGLPKFESTASIKRSNTLTLDSLHKDKLDKRRQSSLAVRRQQNRRNLPMRINKVWTTFAQYVIDQIVEEKEEKRLLQSAEAGITGNKLLKIIETPEVTPEPNANVSDQGSSAYDSANDSANVLDEIINRNRDDKNKKKKRSAKHRDKDKYFKEDLGGHHDRKKGHESLEVLQIDPRLFVDAKTRSSQSERSSSDSSKSEASSSDSASSDSDFIDVFSIEISYSQFNIVLNDNCVEVSPDMSAALIWQLLNVNGMVAEDIRGLGQESDNLHNNPMKERGFHNKQFKKIMKCVITYAMIECMMKKIACSGVINRQDKRLHPKHLSYEKRNYCIWDKIFEHLCNKTSFNVEEEYLYGALSEDELRDSTKIITMLSSLDSHWQHRVQLMEYIDDKLSNGSPMERDIFFASILSNNMNYIEVLKGWSCQLTDDRSGVARTGVTLLPAVLSSMLLCIQHPAYIFDADNVIHPMYNGIFTLVKNRRLKDMADDAYEALIQITDIFAEIASDLNDYTLMDMIIKVLEDHSNPKIEKHEKARESCIGGIGFLLYGIEQPDIGNNPNQNQSSGESKSNADDDLKMPEKGAAEGTKLSRVMQRAYLLQYAGFVASFGNILKYGVTDKSADGRRKSFELLQKLEGEKKGQLLEELLQNKWDFTIQKKYKNWKKLNERKKNSNLKKNSSKKGRKNKKKSSKRMKGSKGKKKMKNALKDQVKKNKKDDSAVVD